MRINKNLYPFGKHFCLTMSYDDGREFDRRVVEIFNKNGIKGSFHLNSSRLDLQSFITKKEILELYKNHEVSCHTLNHPFLQNLPVNEMLDEIRIDKEILENACGYPVRGMSYPFGTYNDTVISAMKLSGMNYAREVSATNGYNLPSEFLAWRPTTHHNGNIKDLFTNMINSRHKTMQLLYIWGHSYEFDNQGNWNVLEEFCEMAGGNDDVWYATNIEIFDYVTALRNLEFSVENTMCYNPSGISVWVNVNDNPIEIKPGNNKF